MWRLLLDENFSNRVMRALLRHQPDVDFVRAQDLPEIAGKDDPTVLEWAANENRIVLTHDVRTMTRYAYDRVREGQPMPGIIEVSLSAPIGEVVEDLLITITASAPEEYEGLVHYIPINS
jgi:predicted nuclease of predicted toxin-antitoxin system